MISAGHSHSGLCVKCTRQEPKAVGEADPQVPLPPSKWNGDATEGPELKGRCQGPWREGASSPTYTSTPDPWAVSSKLPCVHCEFFLQLCRRLIYQLDIMRDQPQLIIKENACNDRLQQNCRHHQSRTLGPLGRKGRAT